MKCKIITEITILVVLMTVIVLNFTACDKKIASDERSKDYITEDMYEKVTNVYKIKDFDLPDGFYYRSYSVSEYIYIYGYLESGNYVQLKYNTNGELIDTINLSKIADIKYFVVLSGMQSNGNYVIVGEKEIFLISQDGNVIAKQDSTYEYNSYLYIDKSDEIYIVLGNKLYIYDNILELIAEIECTDTLSTISADKDGNIIIQSANRLHNSFILDKEDKTLNIYSEIAVEQNSRLFFGIDNNPYIIDENGIYIHDDEPKQIMSWENSDISYKETRDYIIINENTILCRNKDYFDTSHKPILLERIPDDEIQEKVIINLAITGFDNVGIIKEAIALFNRDNDTYRVVTTDYTKYNSAPNYDQAIEKMNQDLIAGNIPDIMMIHFTMFNSINTYTDKNIFADLSEAIGSSKHELLKCVQNSYCRSDKIYEIPIFMELDTILTKPSVIGENESFTLDKLYSLAENMEENQALFSKYVGVLNTALYDFIDYEAKTCNFESDEFIRLLEFQKSIDDYIDKEKGAINNFTNNYFLTSDNLYSSLANDEILFLQLPLYKLNGYLISKICYGDDDFIICGYPNSTGNASMLSTDYTFCITEQSKVKNGAWEFIEFLLSDTIQNSETLTSYGLPVTVSGIEKLLDYYAEHYLYLHQTSEINKNPYSGDVSINIISSKEIRTDDHPNKESADYVVTLTDEDKQKLLDFFNSTDVKSYTDKTVTDIVNEEYYEYYGNAITAEEAAKRIQNRIFIYLNE